LGNPIAFGKLFEEKNTNWLVADFVREVELILFTGGRESGRTILALSLVQGIAARSVFLDCICARHPVAYFNRYDSRNQLWRLASRVSPKMMMAEESQAAVYGCWGPDDKMPNIDDESFKELVEAGRVLVIDTIPDPRETDCPDEFLRSAQRLARSGPGLVMFGASSWNNVQAIRNRVHEHFLLTKSGDKIVFEDARGSRRVNLFLTPKESHIFQMTLKPASRGTADA